MKTTRRIASLLLALVMVIAMAAPVWAADDGTTNTITISNTTEGYTYVAYRVFEGTLDETTNELQNLDWSDGVNAADLLTALKSIEVNDVKPFASCVTAVDVATVLDGITAKDDAITQAFADAVAANLASPTGSANEVTEGEGYVISVTGDGYYFVKTTVVPSVTGDTAEGSYTRYILKVVGDVTVTHKGNVPSVEKKIVEDGTDVDASDAAIGDKVTFKLTATLPSDYDYYKSYKLVFHDTLSKGLTYNGDAQVYITSADGTNITSYFTIDPNAAQTTGGGSLTITCADLTQISDVTNSSEIVVIYTATLNNDAEVGSEGNPNTVKLEYSNNPNEDGSGTPSTGETPDDKVIVFTYELDVTKVDGVDDSIKLKDAEFKLYRVNDDEENEYAVVDSNGKITGWTTTETEASTLTTGENGLFKIAGLDAGTYYLKETKAPAGYNLPDEDFKVVITAEVTLTEIKSLDVTVGGEDGTGNTNTGIVEGTIANNSGATLPETGGIGTTIFYVVGGLLVAAAVVLLVTKRRMGAAE